MNQNDLLRLLVTSLEKHGLRYYITGSMTTIFFGEYRSTVDIDVVVALGLSQVDSLANEFPQPDFYFNEPAAREAVTRGGQFNIIHVPTGLRIDVMVPRDTPFDRSRFARVVRLRPHPDYEATFCSPEDIILKKLEFFREGRSDKHLRDIASVIKVSGDTLDYKYIATWAIRLGVDEIWREMLVQTGRLPPLPPEGE